jgi:UDP-2,3-diacylglucosamine hydrolase
MEIFNKKIYFLSDFHLGAPDQASSLAREKKICRFLDEIAPDIDQLFLLGDMFDFWYEYKDVVPKGYTRILGKLAELTDRGIPVHFFVGNHDMWMKGYFERELNIPVYHEPKAFELKGKKFLIGHGDGLGPGDYGYKFIKRIFRNPVCQGLFGTLHPYVGMGLANYFSRKSREATGQLTEREFLGVDKEWILIYCQEVLAHQYYDYFVFGHRHLPIDFPLSDSSRYINTGDWIQYDSYAVFDGQSMNLQYYTP